MDIIDKSQKITVITFVVSVIIAIAMVTEITSPQTYLVLPIWFFLFSLFSSSLSLLFIKYNKRLKNPTHTMLMGIVASFFITLIITIFIKLFYGFQALENNKYYLFFTVWPSIAGILYEYLDVLTQHPK